MPILINLTAAAAPIFSIGLQQMAGLKHQWNTDFHFLVKNKSRRYALWILNPLKIKSEDGITNPD
ncbi:hypothetical protein QF042_005251 [Pedobacter sp. W3I1]|uniref:hypothetical protein n=1 Tax=Pedobacter sp. W3I1 TaxID=3042291 RepID=UPI00277E90B3|nr:hypothetical protein [Pedobacter sp. W3I1]MDQ0641686.1 hypothetical protein [Pedobacter sp. W3I1]